MGMLWKPATRVVRKGGVTLEYVGENAVVSDAQWARYQRALAGPVEMVFKRTARSGGTRLIYLDNVNPGGLAIEAKYGNMGQLFDLGRYRHFVRQSNDYLDIAAAFELRVQYRASTELGAVRLLSTFTYLHPEALRSGFLTVRWYPMP